MQVHKIDMSPKRLFLKEYMLIVFCYVCIHFVCLTDSLHFDGQATSKLEIRIFYKGVPLRICMIIRDFHKSILSICMERRIFYKGGTLRICMKSDVSCFVWECVSFTKGCLEDLQDNACISDWIFFGFVWK